MRVSLYSYSYILAVSTQYVTKRGLLQPSCILLIIRPQTNEIALLINFVFEDSLVIANKCFSIIYTSNANKTFAL